MGGSLSACHLEWGEAAAERRSGDMSTVDHGVENELLKVMIEIASDMIKFSWCQTTNRTKPCHKNKKKVNFAEWK